MPSPRKSPAPSPSLPASNSVPAIHVEASVQRAAVETTYRPDMRETFNAITALIEDEFADASFEVRTIIRENVEMAILEGVKERRLNKALAPFLPHKDDNARPPVADLSDLQVEAIKKVGDRHPWDGRPASSPATSVDWVVQHYGAWMPGLLKNHIRLADPKLYAAFMKQVSRTQLPDGVDIPSRSENEERKCLAARTNGFPREAYVVQAIGREFHAARLRTYRQRQKRAAGQA